MKIKKKQKHKVCKYRSVKRLHTSYHKPKKYSCSHPDCGELVHVGRYNEERKVCTESWQHVK